IEGELGGGLRGGQGKSFPDASRAGTPRRSHTILPRKARRGNRRLHLGLVRAMAPRVGVGVTPFQTDDEATIRLAVLAEELGYARFAAGEGCTQVRTRASCPAPRAAAARRPRGPRWCHARRAPATHRRARQRLRA